MNRVASMAAALLAGTVAVACVPSDQASEPDGPSGQLLVSFTLPDGVDNQVAQYWVTKGGVTVSSGEADTGGDSVGALFLTELEPADDYHLWLTISRVGAPACTASLSFRIVAEKADAVALPIQCVEPESAEPSGDSLIPTAFNYCPKIAATDASTTIAAVGSSVMVSVSATDRDQDPLTFLWSARSGLVDDPTASSTSYTCTREGTDILVVEVFDGPTRGCRKNGQVGILCVAAMDAGVVFGPDAAGD